MYPSAIFSINFYRVYTSRYFILKYSYKYSCIVYTRAMSEGEEVSRCDGTMTWQLHVEGGASGPYQCRHNRPQLPGSSLRTSTSKWIGGPSLGGKGRSQISIIPSQLEAGGRLADWQKARYLLWVEAYELTVLAARLPAKNSPASLSNAAMSRAGTCPTAFPPAEVGWVMEMGWPVEGRKRT